MAIVRAVGIAVGSQGGDAASNPARAQRMEAAMLAAVHLAQAQGVNDDDVVRQRIAAAVTKQSRVEDAIIAAVQQIEVDGVTDEAEIGRRIQQAVQEASA